MEPRSGDEIWHRPEFQGRRQELINKHQSAKLANVKPSTLSSWQKRYTDFPKTVLSFRSSPEQFLHEGEFREWHNRFIDMRGQRGRSHYIAPRTISDLSVNELRDRRDALQVKRDSLLKRVADLDLRIERATVSLNEAIAAGYGTSGGVELTDEVIERLADEAEQGYPIERMRPRREGHSTSLLAGRIILVSYSRIPKS